MSRERPILFSAPMVRAILEGRKTVTRRVVKPQPSEGFKYVHPTEFEPGVTCWTGFKPTPRMLVGTWTERKAPYRVGDRLWVREAWRAPASLDACSGSDIADRCLGAGYRKPWAPVRYEADGVFNSQKDWREFGTHPGEATPGRYRHARFMPRWASRINLKVTAVRVERLQDITEEQAIAEGSQSWLVEPSAIPGFVHLWDGLAKPGTRWADNPWVWVVEFRRVEGAP